MRTIPSAGPALLFWEMCLPAFQQRQIDQPPVAWVSSSPRLFDHCAPVATCATRPVAGLHLAFSD